MNSKDISQAKNPDLVHSMAAMKRAALEARRIAIETNTAIIVMKDQKIIRKTAKELKEEMMKLTDADESILRYDSVLLNQ
jgi:acid phosphatase family membrane protein YuiD